MITKKEPGSSDPRQPLNLKVHHEECCTPNITALSRGCQEDSKESYEPAEWRQHFEKGMNYEA